jgi:hypothetical protein
MKTKTQGRIDIDLQFQCVDRAVRQFDVDRHSTILDLFFANENVPMDFERLLNFPLADFAHDIFGIQRHMNRQTTKLEDCFVPRCAKNQ